MDAIGTLLANERKKKGLEVIDVEHTTGIRAAYLLALEEGRYSVLPGEVYVKGFIRNYGNYLGLDGAQLVQLYNDNLHGNDETTLIVTTATKVESSRKKSVQRQVISVLVILLLLSLSAWGLYSWQKTTPASSAIPMSKVSTTAPTIAPTAAPTATATSQAVAMPATNRAITLLARYSDRCWTSVIADGKSIYEGVPKSDEILTWQADRQIVVNFGNAAAVELTLNGQPVGKIGERGDVVVRTFTAPTVKP